VPGRRKKRLGSHKKKTYVSREIRMGRFFQLAMQSNGKATMPMPPKTMKRIHPKNTMIETIHSAKLTRN
jgi:hypothetical protein